VSAFTRIQSRVVGYSVAGGSTATAVVTLCLLYAIGVGVIQLAGGAPFGYPLDDTYIHMDIGRTIATSGVWGLNPGSPAAASSSPLWSLLLTGMYSLNLGDAFLYVPLLLDMAAGCALVWLLVEIFETQPHSIALVAAIAFAAALPSLSVLGMEHVLHTFLAVALCHTACRRLASGGGSGTLRQSAWIGMLSALAVAVRYESLFLVAPLALLALLRWRPGLFTALFLGAALPVFGFGLYWIYHGGWLLPNTLLVKTDITSVTGVIPAIDLAISQTLRNFRLAPAREAFDAMLAALVGFLVWRMVQGKRLWDLPVLFGLCALAATLGHFAFASVGWLYRYESWLIVLDLTAIGLLSGAVLNRRMALLLAAVIVGVFAFRTMAAGYRTSQAIDDRRFEHLTPARFVDSFYPGQTVMVNDIGAVTWYAPRTRLLDIYGLGNNEPVRFRLAPGGYDKTALRDWANQTGTSIAIVQPCWPEVSARIPDEWSLVATWEIPRNVVFEYKLIAFYAVAPGARERLRQELGAFPMPAGMKSTLDPPASEIANLCESGSSRRPFKNKIAADKPRTSLASAP